jgi:hypothetical protein
MSSSGWLAHAGCLNTRQQLFLPYQGSRDFDSELLISWQPFWTACGFAVAKSPGYEADNFFAAAVASEERAAGAALATGEGRDAFQLASSRTLMQALIIHAGFGSRRQSFTADDIRMMGLQSEPVETSGSWVSRVYSNGTRRHIRRDRFPSKRGGWS